VSYAQSRPVRDPSGIPYEVLASPRGDLLVRIPESGPLNWLTTAPGWLGLLSLLINLVVFRGRWQVFARPLGSTEILGASIVRRRDVDGVMSQLAAEITAGQVRAT
jgi:hypothetical protein